MVPLVLTIDGRSATPLHRQIYNEIRAAVLSGRLAPGARLPSTRALAADLAVSRNTAAGAFDQLLAEGYIEGRRGAGTFVARALPDDLLRVPRGAPRPRPSRASAILSARGKMLASTVLTPVAQEDGAPRAFRPGIPALDAFPRELWARMAARIYRNSSAALLSFSDPAGYPPLRRAIAEYLRAARGVRCSAGQVIVTSGSQQALDLAARVLLDAGDTVWVEDPGYLLARGALTAAGIRPVPVPVDAEGLSVTQGERLARHARMAYVSPSHQYPLGVTMSLARRMALLAWASQRNAWIVEDDYGSEFRYAGRPLASLQGLDTLGRVLYIGTFSKVLFPSLRLGYLVAPEGAVEAFAAARALADRYPPVHPQAMVAEFLAEGHFGRHIRRMRTLYAERQAMLLGAARREWGGLLDVSGSDAGMHLVGWLPNGVDDRAVSRRAALAGVTAPALSDYYLGTAGRPGLLLGYASVNGRKISEGARTLALAMINLAQ
jgi:GntR family transcriptional regulator/MocR family aminotransferase